MNRAWPGTIVDYLSRKKERERGLYTWSEASFFRMKRNGEMKFCVFCDFQYGNLVHNINFLLRRSIREYFFLSKHLSISTIKFNPNSIRF